MPRNRVVQKRFGKKENGQFGALLKEVKGFKIFPQYRRFTETQLNAFLINHLLQKNLGVENRKIVSAQFVGETFRPECLLRGKGKYPICAIECKKLDNKFAKNRWKEGLSQSLLYSHYYKAVIYVLFDYSGDAKYAKAFYKGNRVESRFAKELREQNRVYIVALKPESA